MARVSLDGERTTQPKPDAEVPGVRAAAATVGRTRVGRIEVPGTTAQHPRPILFYPSRTIRRCARIVLVLMILTPFPDIAMYIVQPERIGIERTDRGGLFAAPLATAVP